jgi:fructokinase
LQIARLGPITAGAIASFGPLDLDRGSRQFGALTGTPKPGWTSFNVLGAFAEAIRAPAALDTDVNCAALAELRHGAGRGLDRLCYVTIGTGIGVGIVEQDRNNPGAAHPEAGHIRVPHAPDDYFAGICPAHTDCLEGLASGPAMAARWGKNAEHLPADHLAWAHEAHYIASLCVNLAYTVRPQRIVLGGGVMEQSSLIGAVRARFVAMAAGYALDRYSDDPGTYLCAPHLTDPSPGLVGAFELARDACRYG